MDDVNAAYIFQQTVSEIGNTVMPKNKALLVLFIWKLSAINILSNPKSQNLGQTF